MRNTQPLRLRRRPLHDALRPRLDLSTSTPTALLNGYDRQVLKVEDLLVVRDTVESNCPAIWRPQLSARWHHH